MNPNNNSGKKIITADISSDDRRNCLRTRDSGSCDFCHT